MAQAQRQEAANESEGTSALRKPVDSAKHGNVEIAIWKNQGEKGEFYTASAPRISYREGEEWKEGSSFGRHDLLDLAEAAREAALKIRDLQKGQSRGR